MRPRPKARSTSSGFGNAFFLVDQDKLGRSAANVEDQCGTVARLQQLVATQHGKARLFLRLDDIEDDAGFTPNAVDKLFAVSGPPAGFGCDRAREGDVAAPKLLPAHRKGPDRPVHRILRELSGPGKTLAKANDSGKSIDDRESAVDWSGNQQAAIVGAEVDCSVGMTRVMGPPLWQFSRGRRTWLRILPQRWSRRTGDTIRHEQRPFLSFTTWTRWLT